MSIKVELSVSVNKVYIMIMKFEQWNDKRFDLIRSSLVLQN